METEEIIEVLLKYQHKYCFVNSRDSVAFDKAIKLLNNLNKE